MIQEDTKRMIKNACGIEYTNAITPDEKTRRGRYFNSLHEGYAVLQEKIREANENTQFANYAVNDITLRYIMMDDIDMLKDLIESTETYCVDGMAELAQVVAVCKKFLDTIEKYCGGDNNE